MIDAIDELVARSKDHRELRAFHQFHKAQPEVLNYLTSEIQLRIEHGFEAFSYHSLWQYARWKLEMQRGPGETFLMNDHAAPFYARAITILHPEFNGRCEFRKSKADKIFGTEVEPVPDKRPKNYARRLQWAGERQLRMDGGPRIRASIAPQASNRTSTQGPSDDVGRAKRATPLGAVATGNRPR